MTRLRNSPRRCGLVRKPSLPARSSLQSRASSWRMLPASAVWEGWRPKVRHLPMRCFVSDSHLELGGSSVCEGGLEVVVDWYLLALAKYGTADRLLRQDWSSTPFVHANNRVFMAIYNCDDNVLNRSSLRCSADVQPRKHWPGFLGPVAADMNCLSVQPSSAPRNTTSINDCRYSTSNKAREDGSAESTSP